MFLLVFFLSVTAVITIFYTLFNNVNQTQINQNQIALTPTATPTYPPMIFPTETTTPTEVMLPSISISPTITPKLESIPRLSTVGWRSVSNNGVNFLIPNNATCTGGDANCTSVVTPTNIGDAIINVATNLTVEPYEGFSRREQYISKHENDIIRACNPLFVEATFGSINALQIAANTDCYDAGAIVTVVGDKMVIFWSLMYENESRVIARYDVRDTIVSTLTY